MLSTTRTKKALLYILAGFLLFAGALALSAYSPSPVSSDHCEEAEVTVCAVTLQDFHVKEITDQQRAFVVKAALPATTQAFHTKESLDLPRPSTAELFHTKESLDRRQVSAAELFHTKEGLDQRQVSAAELFHTKEAYDRLASQEARFPNNSNRH